MNSSNKLETRYRKLISLVPEMDDDEEPNYPLMGHFNLQIPEYQRPYSWKKDNINTLLDDLQTQIENHPEDDYFIGMFFTLEPDKSSDKKTYEIVDGQQRLTSFNLILVWLKNYFSSNESYEDKNAYVRRIKLVSESVADKSILDTIKLSASNALVFSQLKKMKKDFLKNKEIFKAKQCGVFKIVFDNINKFFLNLIKKDPAAVGKFYDYIFDKVRVLHIIDKPYSLTGDQFFLSLNGKGLKLDQVDLLKSTFIKPFMYPKNEILTFKSLWAGLIKNTKNEMLSKIVNYFRVKLDNKYSELTNGNINFTVNKEYRSSSTLKKEFKDMCHFFENMSPILESESKSEKINLIVKLNKKFNFKRYEEILFSAINKTPSFSLENKACSRIIENILWNLFRINFIYTRILELPARQFIDQIITWCKNQVLSTNSDNVANIIDGLLNTKYEAIINGTDDNLHSQFKDYEFDISKCLYTGKKDNSTLMLFILKLINETYDKASDNSLQYSRACDMVEWALDHYVPKAENKTKFINENGDITKLWESNSKEEPRRITFIGENRNVFDDDFAQRYNIKNGMLYVDFLEVLNRPFNLRLMKPIDNQKKSSKVSLTWDNLRQHFSLENEEKTKSDLKKAWSWLFYGKYEESQIYTYSDVWQKIEYYLRSILKMKNVECDANNLIKIAYLDKHIINREEKDLCHDIRMTRNKIHLETNKREIETSKIPAVIRLLKKLDSLFRSTI